MQVCNHKYQNKPGRACPTVKLYAWIAENRRVVPKQLQKAALSMPLDKSGQCFFHSQNRCWKEKMGANHRFKEYVALSRLAEKKNCKEIEILDADEFVFAGEKSAHHAMGKQKIIDLSDFDFPQYVSFIGAVFGDSTWFNYSRFRKSATFENCVFKSDAEFGGATFEGRALFKKCLFAGNGGFRETKFDVHADFEEAHFGGCAAFNETIFRESANFAKCFFETAYFTRCQFLRGINDALTTFEQANFAENLRMQDVDFRGETTFKSASFSAGEFLDVRFSHDRPTSFDGIKVRECVVFKSLDPKIRVFNHSVSMAVTESNIRGKLMFENANVYLIRQTESVKELSNPGVRKIIIGPGCDKYKLSLEIEIPMETQHHPLISEMAETFVLFFNWQGAVQVRLNVECEYRHESIMLRYFADADITRAEFEKLLKTATPKFADMLMNPASYFRDRKKSVQVKGLSTEIFDIFRKTWSAVMGFAARTQTGRWTCRDTEALLQALAAGSAKKKIVVEVHNHFNQVDILSVGTSKKLAGGNIVENP